MKLILLSLLTSSLLLNAAMVEDHVAKMPTVKAPKEVVLRFRHPKTAPIKAVTVNGPSTPSTDWGQAGSRLRQDASARQAGQGKPWTEFSAEKETIILKGLTGTVTVTAQY